MHFDVFFAFGYIREYRLPPFHLSVNVLWLMLLK